MKIEKLLRDYPALPPEAILPVSLTAAILGVSGRTVRYHPNLKRVWVSKDRYGFRKADVVRLAQEGFQEAV